MGSISVKKIVNNIGWLIFDKVFVLLIGLFVIVKIANYYGPAEYGLYQYALSISTLFGIIVLFIDSRVVKKQYKGTNDGFIIFNTTIAKIILSLVSLIVGVGMLLLINSEAKFNIIYIFLLINNVIINLSFGIQNYFEYQLKSKNVVIASNIATLISCFLQLIAISFSFSIITIVIIVLLSSIIKLIILFIQFKLSFNIKLKNNIEMSLIFSVIRESIPLAITATAATIYTKIDQIMIGSMLNVAEVGIYSVSNKMIGVVAIAIAPVQVSIFPKMIDWYENNIDLYYERYQSITSLTTWLYIIGTILAFLVSPIIFNKFFSDAYIRSLDIFKIHVIGTLFMYNAALRSSHFTINKKTKIIMISTIIATILNIMLNYILIPIIGIHGAALATVVTQFFSLFLSNLFFREGKQIFWLQLKGFNPIYIFKLLNVQKTGAKSKYM